MQIYLGWIYGIGRSWIADPTQPWSRGGDWVRRRRWGRLDKTRNCASFLAKEENFSELTIMISILDHFRIVDLDVAQNQDQGHDL